MKNILDFLKIFSDLYNRFQNTAVCNFITEYKKPITYSAYFGAGTGAGLGLFAGTISELTNYGGRNLHTLRGTAKIAAAGALLFSGAAVTTCLAHKAGKPVFDKIVKECEEKTNNIFGNKP